MISSLSKIGGTSRRGILCVVSGPSGVGKTTLCHRFRDEVADGSAIHSISCTTRSPRPGEVSGQHYHFLKVDDFLQKIANNEFLEHAEVHGHHYGTLLAPLQDALNAGIDVLMDLDVQGAEQIRNHQNELIAQCRTDIFIHPETTEELKLRLAGRGSETDDQQALRLHNAIEECKHWTKYQYVITSRSRDEDYERFASILKAERLAVKRCKI